MNAFDPTNRFFSQLKTMLNNLILNLVNFWKDIYINY